MCATQSPEGGDVLAFSDEIIYREEDMRESIMEPEHVFPKALSPRFSVGNRGRMHHMRGDQFVKNVQVS